LLTVFALFTPVARFTLNAFGQYAPHQSHHMEYQYITVSVIQAPILAVVHGILLTEFATVICVENVVRSAIQLSALEYPPNQYQCTDFILDTFLTNHKNVGLRYLCVLFPCASSLYIFGISL
jgi:hypothetical protein